MKEAIDRCSFLKVTGISLGIGVPTVQLAPWPAKVGAIDDFYRRVNAEAPSARGARHINCTWRPSLMEGQRQ